jgi:hypothetical protein
MAVRLPDDLRIQVERARIAYERAMMAARQWAETAALTHNSRHQHVADVCQQIAIEREAALQQAVAAYEAQQPPLEVAAQ